MVQKQQYELVLLKESQLHGIFTIANTYNYRLTYEKLLGNKVPTAFLISFTEFITFLNNELSFDSLNRSFLIPETQHIKFIRNNVMPIIKSLRKGENIVLSNDESNILNKIYINFIENCIVLQMKWCEFTRTDKYNKCIPLVIPHIGEFEKIINIKSLKPSLEEDDCGITSMSGFDYELDNIDNWTLCYHAPLALTRELKPFVNIEKSFMNLAYDSSTIYGVNLPIDKLDSEEEKALKAKSDSILEYRKAFKILGKKYKDTLENKVKEESSRYIRLNSYPQTSYENMINILKTVQDTPYTQSLETAITLVNDLLMLRELITELICHNHEVAYIIDLNLGFDKLETPILDYFTELDDIAYVEDTKILFTPY